MHYSSLRREGDAKLFQSSSVAISTDSKENFKFALYKALQSGTPFDSKTLLRGLQVITHLFRLQGLFYMDSSSCEAIIFRITYVLENFIQTSSRRFKKLEAAFAQIWGFYGDMSELLEATYLGPPPVTDESVNALVELLPHFRLVKEIWISLANKTSDSDDEKNRNAGPPHTQGGLDRIVDGLQDNDSATSVTLITPPRYRSEQALAKLADCLRSLAWTSLSLTMNFERVTDVSEFGDALGKNRDLKHLSLIGNSKGLRFLRVQDYLGLRAQGIQALSEGLKKNNTLESLEIENNGVDAQGARVLSYALQSHPSLTRLSLAGNHLGMDGAKIIIDRLCLPRGALVELDLSSNVLGSNCDQIFVPLIQSTKSLRHLNIAGVDAGSKAMIPIFEALSSNRSITEFNCGENSIDDQALPALELVLRNNRTLKTLRLHANMLKDSGRLGALIASNTTLESLDIEANEYGSYLPFFESLVFNQTLQTLVIGAGDTNITLEELPQLLTAAVQRMPTLRSLTVSGLISTTNYKALRRSWIAVSGRDEADLVCTVAEHEGDVVQDWDDNDDDDSDQPNDKL
ncbi:hypothetical protein DFJ73DRAFT_263190 [Zopfochytrium polystomum]|nr:hypothetical protein DFJ73DRAFT_263190 [Zopfochytrium polystomum]